MIKIVVPATSANVGPGFDCLGVALSLYNTFYIEEIEEGFEFEGCEDKFKNDKNLVAKSMAYFFKNEAPDFVPSGYRIKFESDIPVSRGLGSSAACIVAGIIAANHFSGIGLKKDALLRIATEIEGHPDNVAPALFGNMTIALCNNIGELSMDIVDISEDIKFCALIPDFRLSTEKSRSVLPDSISYKDAVFNISRAAMLISSLSSGNTELLKYACDDRLHQPYRSTLIPEFETVVDIAYSYGAHGVFLSGAGPTVMTVISGSLNNFIDDIEPNLVNLQYKWHAKVLQCDKKGAQLNILE